MQWLSLKEKLTDLIFTGCKMKVSFFFILLNRSGECSTILKLLYFNSQADISNSDQMTSLQEQINSLPAVAGIVHTAMVLRDEFIKDLTFESFHEVMGPKIKGKLRLKHCITIIIIPLLSTLLFTYQSNYRLTFLTSNYRFVSASPNELVDGSRFFRDVFIHGFNCWQYGPIVVLCLQCLPRFTGSVPETCAGSSRTGY